MDGESKNGSLCAKCHHHLVAQAVRCSNCGTLVAEAKGESEASQAAGLTYSRILPFWKYCLLIVATYGLYELWWFYRTWSFVKKANSVKGVWANVGSTAGSALPIVNLFFIWQMLSSVRRLASDNNLPARFSVKYLFLSYQLLLIGRFVYDRVQRDLHGITGPDAISYVAAAIGLLFAPALLLFLVQMSINDYLKVKEQLPQRKGLNKIEIAVVLIGACVWVLLAIGVWGMWSGQIDINGNQLRP